MASEAQSSRTWTKAYLYLMALVCVGLVGGILYISNPKFRENESLEAKRTEQTAVATQIIKVWKDLGPSVKKYHDDVAAGLIEKRDDSILNDVPRALREIFNEMQLSDRDYVFGTPEDSSGGRNSSSDFDSTTISIDLKNVTIETFNLFLNKLRAKFGKVASIYSIDKLDPKSVKDSQISDGVLEEVRYDSKITLLWYKAKESKRGTSTSGRRGAST